MPDKEILDSGTYEIIQNRLNEQRAELSKRLTLLNGDRKAIFSSNAFELTANQRITTENNGVARGIIAFGDSCLFAYNVHFGLRGDIQLSDVFSQYRFENNHFEPQVLTLINDPDFVTDFTNLYKYYRDAIFAKFTRTENYLYMIFQTSGKTEDRKAFKWLIKDNHLTYIDDRSVHEVKPVPQHDFKWIRSGLEDRRLGTHPHVSIQDKVFIEAIGGDITFKIEDNTHSGKGIYSEPVHNKDQQLDDAEYHYADLGNLIAIKIKPYQEDFRAYLFNVRTKEVMPVDTLLDAGVILPGHQGIIFPNGYYLQNGESKIFDSDLNGVDFIKYTASPNGEDYLYTFYQRSSNTYMLMSYNVIMQQVETPIICNGFTIFDNGQLIYFRSETEAVRHHQVQIWQTPYTSSLVENEEKSDHVLYKIGNKDIVKAMAEGQEIVQLLMKQDSYEGLYEDIYKQSNDVLDSYFWLKDLAAYDIAEPLSNIKEIANTAIDEYAKVQVQRQHAHDILKEKRKDIDELSLRIRNKNIVSLDQLVLLLSHTRRLQGAVIDLLNVKYISEEGVNELKTTLHDFNQQLSQETIAFLLKDEALIPYEEKVLNQKNEVAQVTKVIDAQVIDKAIKDIAGELEMLIDILNSLKIDDTTQTTKIIEKISLIFSFLNEVKADLTRTVDALRSKESASAFFAQMTLLEQSIVNFLDLSDSIEKCDDYLTKVSIHIEELESKFADFEDFVLKIADKRDEVLKAFNGKKEILIEQMNRRTGALEQIGMRVLKNIQNKASSFNSAEDIYAFFSSDLMIEKVRSLSEELRELGDVAKSENLETTLKVAQENVLRDLKDKTDLFVDGHNVIGLGDYKFLVNKQNLSLTIVRRDQGLFFHLIGTSFYKKINDDILYKYVHIWDQELVSENMDVYRASYLAFLAFQEYLQYGSGFDYAEYINDKTERDYSAGYLKGVHNTDAVHIYEKLLQIRSELGNLHYSPAVRVAARIFWHLLSDADRQKLLQLISAARAIQNSFPDIRQVEYVKTEISRIYTQCELFYYEVEPAEVSEYLYDELSLHSHFTCSGQSMNIKNDFLKHLKYQKKLHLFESEVENSLFTMEEHFYLIQNWLAAFLSTESGSAHDKRYMDEAACLLLFPVHESVLHHADDVLSVNDLRGTHPTIKNQELSIQYHDFVQILSDYLLKIVPAFMQLNREKEQMIGQYKKALKISEFEPKVLSSFVRNRLINEVYFPLIGSNLAKQIGTVGDDKRTARMGMLLLISPPGYGKTTLMEYIAKVMGLHFVKINGPTIGHSITSIDPAEATTSGAREELKKINLAFEMADNVMLYIDDIQHCSPEFLQKFISLADGQRKMDGIFEEDSKTYDLRGHRFCIVMAGNPYTESGEQFKIPDMLANRADVYNLGDVIGNTEDLFNLSLIENAVQENRYLQRISNRSFDDLYQLIHYIETGADLLPDMEGNYSRQEIDDAIAVLKNVTHIRNVVVKVNRQYILSAAMKDAYRTEPAFKLQGSYRNMNRLVSRVVPLMNDEELQSLIISHYESESHTLTSDAEANLLKLKEIAGVMDALEEARWAEIKEVFNKNNQFGGLDGTDTTGQVLIQLSQFNDHLKSIADAVHRK